MARLAARLHEEAQALIDQQAVASATQRQQAQTEMAKLTTELATLQAQLAAANGRRRADRSTGHAAGGAHRQPVQRLVRAALSLSETRDIARTGLVDFAFSAFPQPAKAVAI